MTSRQLFARKFAGWVAPGDCFAAFFSNNEQAFWLDRDAHPTQRFSIIGDAEAVCEFEFGEAGADALIDAQNSFADSVVDATDLDLPFDWRPGIVFALAYDPNSTSRALIVSRGMVFDHEKRQMWFVGFFGTQAAFDRWFFAALLNLTLTGGNAKGYRFARRDERRVRPLAARHSDSEYLQLIESTKAEIAAGNVYQLCLTNQLTTQHSRDPLDVFYRLREINPAPYSGYMRVGDFALVSASVEQFLTANREGLLQTKPIKGTRARSPEATPEADELVAAELASDVKERAENLMIVDLMRNDLTKVCEPDSVKVTKLFEVESYATVHQLVSTIEGRIREGFTHLDAVLAMFPGGSMTGAPKIRAVELIEQFEGGPRGTYSGLFGYFGHFGHTDIAMVIRSIVFEGDTLTIGVGGGITSDSDPEFEVAETKLKARALLAALEVPDAW
ncbi:MAG: aminodeoxychorismate synthase component [Actinomycetota bacterium]|jgi:anthranilate/para-aminobenzoate synthase component I